MHTKCKEQRNNKSNDNRSNGNTDCDISDFVCQILNTDAQTNVFYHQDFFESAAASGSDFSSMIKYQNQNYLFVYSPISTTGASVACLVPESVMLNQEFRMCTNPVSIFGVSWNGSLKCIQETVMVHFPQCQNPIGKVCPAQSLLLPPISSLVCPKPVQKRKKLSTTMNFISIIAVLTAMMHHMNICYGVRYWVC